MQIKTLFGNYHSLFKQQSLMHAKILSENFMTKRIFAESQIMSPKRYLIQREEQQLCSGEAWQTRPYQAMEMTMGNMERADMSLEVRHNSAMQRYATWFWSCGNNSQPQTEVHSTKLWAYTLQKYQGQEDKESSGLKKIKPDKWIQFTI